MYRSYKQEFCKNYASIYSVDLYFIVCPYTYFIIFSTKHKMIGHTFYIGLIKNVICEKLAGEAKSVNFHEILESNVCGDLNLPSPKVLNDYATHQRKINMFLYFAPILYRHRHCKMQ